MQDQFGQRVCQLTFVPVRLKSVMKFVIFGDSGKLVIGVPEMANFVSAGMSARSDSTIPVVMGLS